MPRDMKDWLDKKAQELAMDLYGKEYYDLPADLQAICYATAEERYTDELADIGDRLIEEAKLNGKVTN